MASLLPHLLVESAARHAERPAIVMDGRTVTYGELEGASNRLARSLVGHGVKRGDRVALWLPKSIHSIIALYGIMKAGAAYVPIDPAAPPARLAFIARDCAIAGLVTAADLAPAVEAAFGADAPMRAVWYTGEARERSAGASFAAIAANEVAAESAAPSDSGAREDDVAYILYTSGSTGEPKGVMIQHRSALAFVEWAAATFQISMDDRLANHAPFHFDLSTFDLFAAARAAASVFPVSPRIAAFPAAIARQWAEHRLTVWYATPSTLILMLTRGNLANLDLSALRVLLFAGEVFPVKYVRELMKLAPRVRFANLYGPTETNVCTWFDVRALEANAAPVPIGRAACGDELHILDEAGRSTPPGVAGELWVSGPSVMLGYWRRPEQTARTLRTITPLPGREILAYKTGDLVREMEDGNLEYLGRLDHQIKTRGYRVELGEIEFALHEHPAVDEAVVLAIPDDEITNRLKAIVVRRPEAQVSEANLKEHCARTLPRYMVPEIIEFRSNLPRTSSGKVDRRALSDAGKASSATPPL
jgi:amino acid adenylation domain-containing protein